jgi:hypothetical protein
MSITEKMAPVIGFYCDLEVLSYIAYASFAKSGDLDFFPEIQSWEDFTKAVSNNQLPAGFATSVLGDAQEGLPTVKDDPFYGTVDSLNGDGFHLQANGEYLTWVHAKTDSSNMEELVKAYQQLFQNVRVPQDFDWEAHIVAISGEFEG